MQPKFSIVVPVYNVAKELPRAIESVVNQTFTDWELILVDDGSTDNSLEVCQAFANGDNRILALHQANCGVVSARQNGFDNSHGEWILFLDGDDAFECSALEKLVETTLGEGADAEIIQFGYKQILFDDKEICHAPMLSGSYKATALIASMNKSPLEFLGMCIWNKCCRRKIVQDAFTVVGDVRISHSEDGLFAFAAFLESERVYFLKDYLYLYIMRCGSAVHRINENIVAEKEAFVRRLQELSLKSGKFTEMQIIRLIDFYCYEACCYIFLTLRRNHASMTQMREILKRLNSSFLFEENSEWTNYKRRLMRYLLGKPRLYSLIFSLW